MSISAELEQALGEGTSKDEGGRVGPEESEGLEKELKAIENRLRQLAKENGSIERSIKTFENLDQNEREMLRESARTNAQLAAQLERMLSELQKKHITGNDSSKTKVARMAHESSCQSLKKESKRLEQLTAQIVYKEKELLHKYKMTQEFQRMSVSGIEHTGLLQHPSSVSAEADPRSAGDYEDSKGEAQKGNAVGFLQDFDVKYQEAIEKERQDKIHEVCVSVHNVSVVRNVQINKMFEDLREIVIEQGETLTQVEKNTEEAAAYTGKAVEQLAKTDQRTRSSNVK